MKSPKPIIKLLESLLLAEYQQRDLYESYDYWLTGALAISVQEHLQEHIKQEMEHIRTLQRYLVGFGGKPVVHRLKVPEIKNPTLDKILEADLRLERVAVVKYIEAIQYLEDVGETPLRVDLENILIEEQEHVHDLSRWLVRRNPWYI